MKITIELTPAQIQDLAPWCAVMKTTPAKLLHALSIDGLRYLYEATSDFGADIECTRGAIETFVERGEGAAEQVTDGGASRARRNLLRAIAV